MPRSRVTRSSASRSTSRKDAGKKQAEEKMRSPSLTVGAKATAKAAPLPSPCASAPSRDSATPLFIKGARLGGAQHSGLLARDERDLEEERDCHGNGDSTPGLSLSLARDDDGGDDEAGEFRTVSGRELYSVGKRSVKRHVGTPRSGGFLVSESPLTSRSRNEREKQASGDKTPARKKKELSCRGRKASDEESEEEAPVARKKTPRRSIRRRRQPPRSESEEEDTSDESDQEDEKLTSIATRLNRGEIALTLESAEDALEDYFTAHKGKAGPTSDHTLAKLARPRMDQGTIENTLRVAPGACQADTQLLRGEHTALFPYWLFQMSHGYNVLLYGLGSKRRLLERFTSEHLSDACHLVVNGFFPGLTTKQILTALSGDLLECSTSFKTLSEHAEYICSSLENEQPSAREVFLLVHNIDGPMLRAEKSQLALGILAQSPCVHVLASIDHINAPLIWDQNKLSKFNWLWHDVTTFELYLEETSFENSLLVQQSGALALSSLVHVTKSLTPNARGIFNLLIQYQLDHHGDASFQGLAFNNLYIRCREKFLVNSDLTLRSQLTEFRDHKLVRSQKGSDGVEYLVIPVEDATLTQFLEQQVEE